MFLNNIIDFEYDSIFLSLQVGYYPPWYKVHTPTAEGDHGEVHEPNCLTMYQKCLCVVQEHLIILFISGNKNREHPMQASFQVLYHHTRGCTLASFCHGGLACFLKVATGIKRLLQNWTFLLLMCPCEVLINMDHKKLALCNKAARGPIRSGGWSNQEFSGSRI